MAELTTQEINYLKRFLVQHYVRYEDVQLELVDHLASGIEEKQSKKPDLKFEDALQEVYKGFGTLGFSQVVKEKEKAMRKFWQKHIIKLFLDFLKPPLIFIAILIFSTTYLIQTFYSFNFWNHTPYIAIMVFALAISLSFKLHMKEDIMNKYLYLDSYYGLSGSILFTFGYIFPSSAVNFNGNEIIELTTPLIWFTSFYLTFFLISLYILAYKIPNGLLKKFNEQYKKYALN
ncbi:hypothetical protein [Portibacter lacus]|nr:hypothetical protein [Portibacter lacus]